MTRAIGVHYIGHNLIIFLLLFFPLAHLRWSLNVPIQKLRGQLVAEKLHVVRCGHL